MFVFALREREREKLTGWRSGGRNRWVRGMGAECASKRGRGVERLAEFFGDLGWVYFKVRGKAWRSEASL